MDSSIQSDDSKNSTGDYAEIGPELMSSMRFHSFGGDNSHYSEISDIMLQPISYPTSGSNVNEGESNDPLHDSDTKDNPYDEPDLTKVPETNLPIIATQTPSEMMLCHNYSRLERMVPLIYVTSESDIPDGENHSRASIYHPGQHYYHTLEQSPNGSAILCTDAYSESDQEGSDRYTEKYLLPNHLSTIFEHPYHILEQSDTLFDADYQETKFLQGCNDEDGVLLGIKTENNEYDRLVDPQVYNILDHSRNDSGLSRIYDVKSGPYSKLETHTASQQKRKNKSVTTLDLSTEIFDDVQYIISPVPTPKPTTPKPMVAIDSLEDVSESDERKSVSKYYGDYERDPIYMENIKKDGSASNDTIKSLSLPNIYQPLEVTAMDPVQDYENYLRPRPSSSGNNKTSA